MGDINESIINPVIKESKRAFNRIKEDPTAALTGGVSVDGKTLGYKGTAERITEATADVTGLTALQESMDAQAQAAADEAAASNARLTAQTINQSMNRKKTAKVQLGNKPSDNLGLSRSRTGVQI